ncbi:MAG TPA: SRPBCC family protein [Polyangia bacterium]|jgi:carbon monoxide dehydrogenase subunit G|nr:SRPBCC family protein [Polyangia bacterium]
MASLYKEMLIDAQPAQVWDAVRDVGALHTRLVPGFVVKTELEQDARVVTFGNGMVAREPILSIDDGRRRLAWAATGGRTTHYNAAIQVLADGPGTRVVWIIDLLPNEMAGPIEAMQAQALAVMKATLERKS